MFIQFSASFWVKLWGFSLGHCVFVHWFLLVKLLVVATLLTEQTSNPMLLQFKDSEEGKRRKEGIPQKESKKFPGNWWLLMLFFARKDIYDMEARNIYLGFCVKEFLNHICENKRKNKINMMIFNHPILSTSDLDTKIWNDEKTALTYLLMGQACERSLWCYAPLSWHVSQTQ